MSLLLFEGAAGTGKTTRALRAARDHVKTVPLKDGQRVLGLTKHHGSRRRMEAALKGPDGVGRAVDCLTIDSFAWQLVRRWRSLARDLAVEVQEGDFQAITSAAGEMLKQREVGPWVARKYPLLVVDEMQDCKGGEVEILANLAPHLRCICAADAFQDLSGDLDNDAIAWAERVGEVERLDYNHRTREEHLLAAARALREGTRVPSWPRGAFEVAYVPKAAVGGAAVSWRIKIWAPWRRSGELAIISPTGPETSPFVTNVLEWVATKEATSKKKATLKAGPFSVQWEASEAALCEKLRAALAIPEAPTAPVSCADLVDAATGNNSRDLGDWVRKQQNVCGRRTLEAGEVAKEIDRIVHRRRAFGPQRRRTLFALTAHQAKNREFESVVVLWPMKVQPGIERQRRLLYNAVTRARERVLVVVEDPSRDRQQTELFSGG